MKMKMKMMMVVAAIFLACLAHAGKVYWGVSEYPLIFADPGGDFSAANGVLYNGTAVYLIEFGQLDGVLDAMDDGSFELGVTAGILSVKYANASGAIPRTESEVGGTVRGTIKLVALIFNTLDYEAGVTTDYIMSGAYNMLIGTDSVDSGNFTFSYDSGFGAGEVSVGAIDYSGGGGAIPEPAAALLALAGVGLLVRRKRRA